MARIEVATDAVNPGHVSTPSESYSGHNKAAIDAVCKARTETGWGLVSVISDHKGRVLLFWQRAVFDDAK